MNLRMLLLFLLASVCPLRARSPGDLLGKVVKSDAVKNFCAAHELTPEGRNVKETWIPLKEKPGTRVVWVETLRLKEPQRKVTYVLTRQGFEERDPLEAPQKQREAPYRVEFAEIEEKSVVDCFPESGVLNWSSRPDDVYKAFGRAEYDITDDNKERHICYWAGPLAGGPPYKFSFSQDGRMSKVILYSTNFKSRSK